MDYMLVIFVGLMILCCIWVVYDVMKNCPYDEDVEWAQRIIPKPKKKIKYYIPSRRNK